MNKTIIGTGIFNLDTIVVREYPQWPVLRPFTDKVVLEEAGGTCGNVMCMLARLGWDAKPLVCLDNSPEGLKVAADLNRFGCDCRYVTTAPGGGTTLLRLTHKKDSEGRHTLSVRAGSPGGSRFPKRHFLRARDEAPAFLKALTDTPAVFFFDDPAAGNRVLARGMKERGALVYFEPSKIATNADLEAVRLSDIIKFSDENVPDIGFADAFDDKVFIQTTGSKGVQYKYRCEPWRSVESIPAVAVVDTEGAGDCFTATLIDRLAELGGLMPTALPEALLRAQEMASRSVGYLGSKGLFSDKTKD